jgi:hypothetical protein
MLGLGGHKGSPWIGRVAAIGGKIFLRGGFWRIERAAGFGPVVD